MAGLVRIINSIDMASTEGGVVHGRQGAVTNPASVPFTVSLGGQVLDRIGALVAATSEEQQIFDDSSDFPATFNKLWFKSDVPVFLQFVGNASHMIVQVLANDPFCMSVGSILGVASTTLITETPTLEAIKKILVHSTVDANYHLILID